MALRDTSWITDSHALVTDYEKTEDIIDIYGSTWRRSRTIVTSEWLLLTYAAAKKYADTHAADTNTNYKVSESNRICGAYNLTRMVDSKGVFTEDT